MEINMAEILKDKSRGIKLYSPIFGDVTFDKVEKDLGEYTIFVTDKGQNHQTFMADGRYNRNGVPVLFPSKEMRDWSKFAWKKGDLLISNDGKTKAVFDGFKDETYASFVGRHALYYLDNDDTMYYDDVDFYKTDFFYIEDEKNAIQRYFNTIEERLGGKLNMETLKVEPTKPKWIPKPFDKVIVRDEDSYTWVASLFSHMKGNRFVTINCCEGFVYCVPYNEETAKLIGTINNYKED